MPKVKKNSKQVKKLRRKLKGRIEETEETLRAISEDMVDAFVVRRQTGVQVVTLSNAEFPYRLMLESMNEGAVTLIPDGTIFYCNPRFAEMVHEPADLLIGRHFQDLLPSEQQPTFTAMLEDTNGNGLRSEFCLLHQEESVPVQLSFYQLHADNAHGIAIIATDISERIKAENKIRSLASELAIAEQEERHRISQILHDDLQQRLFAIRAQLSFASGSFEPGKVPPEIERAVNQIQSWLTEAITITRNLSVDISPSVLQGDGLSEAISWLASRMKEQYGLQLNVNVKNDLRHLPDHLRVTLFQAVREALFNVVKHSGVLEADVMLEQLDGHGRVAVIDHGNGFNPEAIMDNPQAAHGLMIVRDRLNLMGGVLHVESVPGDGTQVKIDFPIEDSNR